LFWAKLPSSTNIDVRKARLSEQKDMMAVTGFWPVKLHLTPDALESFE
jgi:hypothetical protein